MGASGALEQLVKLMPAGMTLMAPLAGSRGWGRGELRLKS